jgi:hypothetical protein
VNRGYHDSWLMNPTNICAALSSAHGFLKHCRMLRRATRLLRWPRSGFIWPLKPERDKSSSMTSGSYRDADRSRRSGNYRVDMQKPRRREIIRGFITFFWTGVPNGYGGSPQGPPRKRRPWRPIPLRRRELQILWHPGHSRKEAPVLPRRGS